MALEAASRLVWSVTGLVHAVSDSLAARFGAVAVRGEIGPVSRSPSGHCYLTLKDDESGDATLRCVMFRRAASLLDFVPSAGMRVQARGRLALYEPRGELQLIVESLARAGDGALYERFVLLKARLQAEGLFDSMRKRPIARAPARIGIVTSLAGAALHDVLAALARRAPHVEAIVYPSVVQGADAPEALVRALALAARRHEVQTIIVCRGGGSIEDLWAFNDERVVRAIVASPIPIVCGVGHETDVTLADFAADLRAPTPTSAAELAAPLRSELLDALQAQQRRAGVCMRHRLDALAQRLDRLATRLARPADALQRQRRNLDALEQRQRTALVLAAMLRRQQLDRSATRLQRGVRSAWERRDAALRALGTRLGALDPKQVMTRGYAWLSDDAGRPIVRARQLAIGQAIRASWIDGDASAAVTDVALHAAPGIAADGADEV